MSTRTVSKTISLDSFPGDAASKYITKINNTGIKIHPEDTVNNKRNILIDSNGISIYNNELPMMTLDDNSLDFNVVDTTEGTCTTTATFGLTGARIGQEDTAHIILSPTAFKLRYGNENYDYVEFYDSRNPSTGLTTYEETIEYVPPSPYNPYIIQKVYTQHDIGNVNNINWVKVDGVDISLSTISFSWPNGVGIRELGQSNATVEINYDSPEVFKAFTLGKRKDSYQAGAFSCVIGNSNAATNDNTFAIGNNSIASGNASMAQGLGSKAFGANSCASGSQTEAHGFASHSEGYKTYAIGSYSHTQNYGTVANVAAQTVIGEYNKATRTGSGTDVDPYIYSDSGNYAFIIGNGSNDDTASRSNALTVDWDGKVDLNNAVGSSNKAYINIRHSSIDSDGATPSSAVYSNNLHSFDIDGTRIGYIESVHNTNDEICMNIGASREVNGSMVYNSITAKVSASGAQTYAMASPINFRKAIHLKDAISFQTATSTNNSYTAGQVKTITITNGAVKSGCTAIAIRGWNFNNSSSGGANASGINVFSCMISGNDIILETKNNASSTAKVDAYVYVTFIENY